MLKKGDHKTMIVFLEWATNIVKKSFLQPTTRLECTTKGKRNILSPSPHVSSSTMAYSKKSKKNCCL
jgi:hypothetical protein